jgi:serine/threonine protein kinase
MISEEGGYQIDKLLRRERGERLFTAVGSSGQRLLVLQVASKADDAPERLHSLGEALAGLSSPQIPELLDWSIKPSGLLQLVTADPSGVFLHDLAADGPLDLAIAVSVWEALLASLVPLHDAGLVYCLSHPERLLIDRKTQVLLPEVGLVEALADRLSEAMPAAGTLLQRLFIWPELVPPELVRGGALSASSDVYQSAALFYRLVSGVSPYGPGMSVEVYNRMLSQQFEPLAAHLPELPPLLGTLVDECLRTDPAERPSNAAQLRARLAHLSLPREPLAEAVVAQAVRPYSSRYPGILSVHSNPNGAEDSLAAEPDLKVRDVEQEVLLGQLEQLRTRREQASFSSRWATWAALAGVVLLVVLALPYFLEFGQPSVRKHEGKLPADSDGLTHREMTWASGGAAPHPTVRSLFDAVSVPLRRRLKELGVSVDAEFEFVPPVLPPYRVRTGGEEAPVVYEFTARNRLRSIKFEKPAKGAPAEFDVLYDALGAPRVIVVLDKNGLLLSYEGIGIQKAAEKPKE